MALLGSGEITLIDISEATEVYYEYYQSDSNIELTNGEWSTVLPAYSDDKFIWQRSVTKFGDYKEPSVTSPICITGARGQSIVSSEMEYYLSSSDSTQSDGEWVKTMPEYRNGFCYWTRNKIQWANPTSTSYTDPVLMTGYTEMGKKIESHDVVVKKELLIGENFVLNSYKEVEFDNAKGLTSHYYEISPEPFVGRNIIGINSSIIITVWTNETIGNSVSDPSNLLYLFKNDGKEKMVRRDYNLYQKIYNIASLEGTIGDWFNLDNPVIKPGFNIFLSNTETIPFKIVNVKMDIVDKALSKDEYYPTRWTFAREDVEEAAKTASSYIHWDEEGATLDIGYKNAENITLPSISLDASNVDDPKMILTNGIDVLASFGKEIIMGDKSKSDYTYMSEDGFRIVSNKYGSLFSINFLDNYDLDNNEVPPEYRVNAFPVSRHYALLEEGFVDTADEPFKSALTSVQQSQNGNDIVLNLPYITESQNTNTIEINAIYSNGENEESIITLQKNTAYTITSGKVGSIVTIPFSYYRDNIAPNVISRIGKSSEYVYVTYEYLCDTEVYPSVTSFFQGSTNLFSYSLGAGLTAIDPFSFNVGKYNNPYALYDYYNAEEYPMIDRINGEFGLFLGLGMNNSSVSFGSGRAIQQRLSVGNGLGDIGVGSIPTSFQRSNLLSLYECYPYDEEFDGNTETLEPAFKGILDVRNLAILNPYGLLSTGQIYADTIKNNDGGSWFKDVVVQSSTFKLNYGEKKEYTKSYTIPDGYRIIGLVEVDTNHGATYSINNFGIDGGFVGTVTLKCTLYNIGASSASNFNDGQITWQIMLTRIS